MANKNPPAHDFAPAWLKIPTYNNIKPSGASSERGTHTSRKDEHSFGFTRHKDNNSLAYHSYFNDCRKDRNDVNNVHYYGVDNSFNESQCNFLSKRPHSRHDFRISLSYKGDNNKHMTKNGGFYGHKGKGGKHHQPDINGGLSNGGSVDSRGITTNNFNQEFPSLQGDVSEEPTSPPALNGSAWAEKPRSMQIQNPTLGKKLQLVKKTIKAENLNDCSRKIPASTSTKSSNCPMVTPPVPKGAASNCRALIPNAKNPVVMKKPPALKEPLPNAALTPIPKLNGKKPTPGSSSHSMEILVKHPKAPGNKSEFLKALRNENKDDSKCLDSVQIPEEPHENGIDISKLSFEEEEEDKEKSILSSSLEAEERLLREMGWKEELSDDESYAPLTEDEVREFRDRTERIQKNGTRRNPLSNLSPLRMAPLPQPEEIATSSSESDSDDL